MADILVRPDQLDADADSIRSHASRIQAAVEAVDAELQKMNPDVFSGHLADALRARYQQIRENMLEFAPFLERFATELNEAATAFRQADTTQ